MEKRFPLCPLFNILAFDGETLMQIGQILNNKKQLEQQSTAVCIQRQ